MLLSPLRKSSETFQRANTAGKTRSLSGRRVLTTEITPDIVSVSYAGKRKTKPKWREGLCRVCCKQESQFMCGRCEDCFATAQAHVDKNRPQNIDIMCLYSNNK